MHKIPLKIILFLRYNKNVEQSEMHMLRRTMGMAMPMKLAMEKKVKLETSFILKS